MRLRVVLVIAGLATLCLGWAPSAGAEGFLDLPGMGAADKLVAGHEVEAGSPATAAQVGLAAVRQTVTAGSGEQVTGEPISDLPGMGAAPVISAERAKATIPAARGGGLEAVAAFGTLVAVAGLFLARRFDVL